ncbi:MAG TPA: hypothetical protein VMS23_08015, partial [Terrimicrobiaceae bacterium]|nr:hypothetical protein [Terrimicrobiaceae bacterium]
ELANGKLHFVLHGKKLEGEWYLVRLHGEGNQWLIIKGGEKMKPVSKKADDTSVLSGKNMKELSKGDRVWQSKAASLPRKIGREATKHVKAAPLPSFVDR